MAGPAKKGQQEIEERRVQDAHDWARDCLAWVRGEKTRPDWRGRGPDWGFDYLHSYLSPISRALDEGRPPPSRSPLWPALQSSLSQLLPALSSTPPAGVESGTIEKVKVEIKKILEKTNPSNEDLTVLMQKNDELTRSIKEKEESIEKLTDENIHVKKEKEKTDIKLEELKRRSDKERNESSKLIDNLKTELQTKVRELESVTEEKDALEKDVDKMKQQEASLAGLLGRGERQRGELAREVSRLQKERQRLKLQLQHVQKERLEQWDQVTVYLQSMTEKLEEQSVKQDDVLEGVAYLVQRDKEKDPEFARAQGLGDKSLLTSLSQDLLKLCLRIERHVGGLGSKFAEGLLGEPLELMEINGDHGFLTRRTFWLLVRRWREVSLLPDSPAPFTLQHLQHVCSSLDPDPSTVQAITASHEEALERAFVYLSEELDFRSIHSQFRNSGRLTEEAWEFLTDESLKSRFQKTDRLLAVVYTLGEQGYRLLRDVMEPSGHEHVLLKLTQDDSGPDDVMARPEPDTSQAETVADAGPDHAPNLTTAAAVHDDADDDGHDVQGDDQALALQDEDRRPATAQELRGLLGTVAGILRDTSRRQEERDQTTARRMNELHQSLADRTRETNERIDRQMTALETRLTARTGTVQSELNERLNAVEERHALDMAGLRDGLADMQRESRERLGEQMAGLGERLAEDRRVRETMMDHHMQRIVECLERSSEKASVETARVEERLTDSMKAHVRERIDRQMTALETRLTASTGTVQSELSERLNVVEERHERELTEDRRMRETLTDHVQRMAECMERSSEKASVDIARVEERLTHSMKAQVKAETELVRTEMAAGLSEVDSKLDHLKNVVQKCFDNISEDVRVRLPKSSEEEK